MYGKQHPTIHVRPKLIESSDAETCCKALKLAKKNMMDWQKLLLDDWLSISKDGRWAASSCGLSVPRQNGKTVVVAARAAFGMVAYGEWVIYTAHLQKTATETFEELRSIFEHPSMSKYVKEIKTALGREEIKLRNGGRVKFLARTRNGGRGQHADLLIFDEAQCLDDTSQSSFVPCLAASKRPQTLYLGTPPDEETPGYTFRRIRSDAIEGRTEHTSWSEWGISSFEKDENVNKKLWAETNPSFGYMILDSTITTELEQLAPDKFARERLGWWSEIIEDADTVISEQQWTKTLANTTPMSGVFSYGVKFEPNEHRATLAGCIKPDEGLPHVDAMKTYDMLEGGEDELMADLMQRKEKAAEIWLDGKGYDERFRKMLINRSFNTKQVKVCRTSDYIGACSALLGAIANRTVTHGDDVSLFESATKSERRKVGKDGWGFGSNADADSTLIESCALAYQAAMLTTNNPQRRARVG